MSIRDGLRVWGLTCPRSIEEVSRARRWIRDLLADTPHADDAELIVSELATNAIVHTDPAHGAGTFHIGLARSDLVLVISVTDPGGTRSTPHTVHAPDDATGGRGLAIVQALADTLTIHGTQRSRTVTASLLTPATADSSPDLPTVQLSGGAQ